MFEVKGGGELNKSCFTIQAGTINLHEHMPDIFPKHHYSLITNL